MSYIDKDKQREYERNWQAARRKAWFDKQGPCVKCASSERLELDHIDPSTKVHHRVWSWAQARRDAELAKCQVLCHDCHLKKTSGEIIRSYPERRKHGTRSRYEAGCRCKVCVVSYSIIRGRMRARRSLARQNARNEAAR